MELSRLRIQAQQAFSNQQLTSTQNQQRMKEFDDQFQEQLEKIKVLSEENQELKSSLQDCKNLQQKTEIELKIA